MSSEEVTCAACARPALARSCARGIVDGESIYVHDTCLTTLTTRIQELLEANNRYLEEGRAARRELAQTRITIDALAAQNVKLQQDLMTKESELPRAT